LAIFFKKDNKNITFIVDMTVYQPCPRKC